MLFRSYWDTCPAWHTTYRLSLPARAWMLPDYLADVAANGITDENHNFPFAAFKRLLGPSMLLHDRGLANLRGRLRGEQDPDSLEGRKRARIVQRNTEIDAEAGYCETPDELGKLDALVDVFRARGLDVTIVAFPLLDETLTETGRQSALLPYARHLAELAARTGVRIVDHTTAAPMVYDDFEIDCDHLTVPAREKYID